MPPRSVFPKAFYIENLGCAKNQVDGEALVSLLMDRGWLLANTPEDAAVIIVNTCGFIESAKKESIGTVMNFRKLYPRKKLVVAGCLSERYGEKLFTALPEADGVFGNRDLSRITSLMESLTGKKTDRGLALPRVYGALPGRKKTFSPPGSVYIKAAEGCGNGCSFCAIPLIRGGFRSRPPAEISAEIKTFLSGGITEFNILAQDLGSYGRDSGSGLGDLLKQILEIPGGFWIRLLYIHPEHFPREILDLCRRDSRLLPYFDLPFQHASGPILTAMGRKFSGEENLGLIADIRSALPDAVIRSTFMLGFPGETEDDFEELLRFQEKAAFEWLGCFTYSPEEDTAAQRLHRKKALRVPRKTALLRKKLIEETQVRITEKRLDRFVNRETELLVEETVEGENLCLARAWFQAPEVDGLTVLNTRGGCPPGTKIMARLIRRNGFDMEAQGIGGARSGPGAAGAEPPESPVF